MPIATTTHQLIREYVSFSALAEDILGLSRARLYELVERGAMPQPCYDMRTKRPVFTREQQEQALAVLRLGVGINGQPIIFYRKNRHVLPSAAADTPARARPRPRTSISREETRHRDLVSSLQSLGVSQADERSVSAAVAECFPNGLDGQQDSDVLRILFRHLRRREGA